MPRATERYTHPTADALLRPDIGTQAQFRKKKPPAKYRYDSSLSPALETDGQNPARERAEALIRKILDATDLAEARAAGEELRTLGQPFLNWAGKAERLSFAVPTLPLFIHERLSTTAILETLKGHKRDRQLTMFDLFADREHPIHEQVLKAYEHKNGWVNRLMLGDSLVVMNSLLHFEALGGQVQMIYMDPPYGVKFGSNFQPFVRKRDVNHNDDEDMTREPEMIKAYRDTWELGLHSYLTYLRDRLLLARELLTDSGSIFVQISDENVHHVREVMDEVFGAENFAGIFSFYKTSSQSTDKIPSIVDYILCYARDKQRQKLRLLQRMKAPGERGAKQYTLLISTADMKDVVRMTEEQLSGVSPIPEGWKVCALGPLTSQGFQEGRSGPYGFEGKTYLPPPNRHWSYAPGPGGEMDRLAAMGRIKVSGDSIRSVLLADDNPLTTLDNVWLDTGSGSFTEQWLYVVQTNAKVIQRCMLMTTDPGDLVLDPTCGSGTTAYVAEQWGRRWITIDISRVPVALARQRLLTATYAYYDLKDPDSGPAGGFDYKRKQNRRGEEVGGIVPHITLKSIANNGPPEEEVLVDRPEVVNNITRVTGPFCVEATIPTPVDWEGDGMEDSGIRAGAEHGSYLDRMLEVLRKSPVLQLGGGRTVAFKNIRPPARTLSLSAEAILREW